jgi:3-oxoacyl-[acyl-carrier-protein] synthase-3
VDLQRRSGFDLKRVDVILYGGGIGLSSMVDPGEAYAFNQARNPLPLFKFPASRIQAELGLPHAPVLGVAQLACSAFQGCLRMARALLLAEPALEHVLCVAADKFPPKANREIVYNLMSDGACAAIVSRGQERHQLLACHQLSRGVYWDCEKSHDSLIAGYFSLVREALQDALRQAGVSLSHLDLLIPHNVNRTSWDLLGNVLQLAPEKLYTKNIARFGHAVASDNVINYVDALDEGRLQPGDTAAWFVTGFGAHWSCSVFKV